MLGSVARTTVILFVDGAYVSGCSTVLRVPEARGCQGVGVHGGAVIVAIKVKHGRIAVERQPINKLAIYWFSERSGHLEKFRAQADKKHLDPQKIRKKC